MENLAAVARGFPGRVKYNLIVPGAAAQHHFEVSKSFVHVPMQKEKVGDRPLHRRQVGGKEVSAAQASLGLPALPLKLVGGAQFEPGLRVVGIQLDGALEMRHGPVGIGVRWVVLIEAAQPQLIVGVARIEPRRALETRKGGLLSGAFRQVVPEDPKSQKGDQGHRHEDGGASPEFAGEKDLHRNRIRGSGFRIQGSGFRIRAQHSRISGFDSRFKI